MLRPPDQLVCAAVDRALRHLIASEISAADIADHLGLPTDRSTHRRLVTALNDLTDRGLLTRAGAGRLARWTLLQAGRDLVPAGAARLADIESPDHRQWRQARELAAANLDLVRSGIRRELAKLARLLEADTPPAAAWLAASKRIEHLTHAHAIGFVKSRFFFRQATGPGWALVGDAGLFLDPAPALGITDAFRDARSLANAIIEGGDEALVRYWRERDACSIELFAQARGMGEPGYNNPLTRLIYRKVAADPALTARMAELATRERSPFRIFTRGEIIRWVTGALLRGDFGVVKPFLAAGKRHKTIMAELELRRRLAQEATVGSRPRAPASS